MGTEAQSDKLRVHIRVRVYVNIRARVVYPEHARFGIVASIFAYTFTFTFASAQTDFLLRHAYLGVPPEYGNRERVPARGYS